MAGIANEPLKTLHHRQVRLPSTVLLDALASQNPHVGAHRLEKRVHQRRFPNAQFTGNEHGAPVPLDRLPEVRVQPIQLTLSSDDRRPGFDTRRW
jgi:hypothetical protein